MKTIKLRAKYLLRVAGHCYNPGSVFEVPEPAAKEMIRFGIAAIAEAIQPQKAKR